MTDEDVSLVIALILCAHGLEAPKEILAAQIVEAKDIVRSLGQDLNHEITVYADTLPVN